MTTTTTSFLMNCPQCGVMIPKGSPCSECHWTENAGAETAGDSGPDLVQAFAKRRQAHVQNYAIFMILAFVSGLVGLTTAFMWFRLMYLGDIAAFFLIGFLTVATAVLGGTAAYSKKLFPIELNCPSCDIRLDELGTNDGYCPNCGARLQ